MNNPTITQRDIARALKLSQATVSLSLANSPRVSQKVRDQVRSYAAEHGYQVDPALAALAAYRTGKRHPGFRGTVAWLTNFDTRDGWKIDAFGDYHDGAEASLSEHGYRLETFWLREPHLTIERLTGILKARGIQCILLCPQQDSGIVADWDFSGFSVVTFGFTLARPRFHMVTAQGFTSMRILYHSLRELGHQRIGFVYEKELEQRSQGSWLGGFLVARSLYQEASDVPPLQADTEDEAALLRWVRECGPDAIIVTRPAVLTNLTRGGWRIPADVSVCLTVTQPDSDVGGMTFDSRRIGEIGARKVISLHHARERGVPPTHEFTAIEGRFHQGTTVGRREAGGEKKRGTFRAPRRLSI